MHTMDELAPGDVLSYSAGSTQTGPYGFRKVRPRGNLLSAVAERWPDVLTAIGRRTPMLINGYPAAVGNLAGAINVDTYLSARVMSRALTLAHVQNHPAILVGQPLFVAHALIEHLAAERPLPDTLLVWVGGYALPQSLERALTMLVRPYVDSFIILQFFGTAEVDAGCFMGRERDTDGALVYHARTDIHPALDGDELLLSLRDSDGHLVIDRFRTGDRARQVGDGWVIWNHRRLHPDVHRELASWTLDDWMRRTGYVQRVEAPAAAQAANQTSAGIWLQLRAGQRPGQRPGRADELEHFEFARRFGFAWLEKPRWR